MDVGSSSGMRLEQWGSILWAFEQNELWGNGSSYLWNVATQNNYEILGAESIWFSFIDRLWNNGWLNVYFSCISMLFFDL
ncbi:hypothetical protein NXU95_15030 [Phocaeicola vulgatus]|nr:hypothetical protein [Phocaeicola vulgatus]